MYSFRNDPGADGVGIVFFDAISAAGGRLDLTLHRPETAAEPSEAWRNPDWDLVEDALAVPALNAYQVHGRAVLTVTRDTDPQALATTAADALATTERGLGLAVRAADCVLVLFADSSAGVVAAAHAGRVGLADGVLVATLERMAELGSQEVTAWIGPHICGECYEVPAELRDSFTAAHPAAWATTSWGTPGLDLGAAAQAQLTELGARVVRVDPCTRSTPSLHSYRRDGAASGRQAGLVWLSDVP